jgi:uncharacterized protein involved in type VI secretion and phage assembly
MTHATPAWTAGIHLGEVVEDTDPEGLNRVRVRLAGLGLELWAPVLIPGGGAGYGVALTPRSGETVAVAFPGGDPVRPLVLGALWSGARARPEAAVKAGETYAIVSPGGAVLRIEDGADPSVVVAADSKTGLAIEPGPSGRVSIRHASGSVTIDAGGIAVESTARVTVSAPTVTVTAAMVTIEAPLTKAAGVVQCDTLIATSVVASTFTNGAGNIW